MFGDIFKRAQKTVDNAVSAAVTRLLVAIPFLVAAGFATTAAYHWLVEQHGQLSALLYLSGGFALVGIFAWLALKLSSSTSPAVELNETKVDDTSPSQPSAINNDELTMAALTALAPIAAPAAVKVALRNWPIVLALGVLAYMSTTTPSSSSVTPAE